MNDSYKQYIAKLEKHVEHLRLVKYYSIQRIDLLIISISGAGVYTCFEILKYIDKDPIIRKWSDADTPFKWCGILFIMAIIVNFVSQWTAYEGSSIALKSAKAELDTESEEDTAVKAQNEKKIMELDTTANKYRKFTIIANLASNAFMILSLIILSLALWNLF